MKILFDHCVPKPFRRAFPHHDIHTTAEMGWEDLKNGKLLAQSAASFQVFLTVDKNIRFQQNLASLPIAIIVLNSLQNTPEALLPFAPFIDSALSTLQTGQMIEIDPSGKITRIA